MTINQLADEHGRIGRIDHQVHLMPCSRYRYVEEPTFLRVWKRARATENDVQQGSSSFVEGKPKGPFFKSSTMA